MGRPEGSQTEFWLPYSRAPPLPSARVVPGGFPAIFLFFAKSIGTHQVNISKALKGLPDGENSIPSFFYI